MALQKALDDVLALLGEAESLMPEGRSRLAATLARSAASASAPRATSPGTSVSSAAKRSVASAAAQAVAGAAFDPGVPPAAREALGAALRVAVAFVPPTPPEHVPSGLPDRAPEGWTGPKGGPFRKSVLGGAPLMISRRTRIPGGDWTVSWAGLPMTAAEDPEAASAAAAAVVEFMGDLP